MQNKQPYTFDRVVRIIITITIICATIWLLNKLSDVLLPFCVACLIAYILEPLVQFNKKIFHIKKRVLATILTLLETLIVIIALGFMFIPSIIEESQF